jgi:hypothetical protein
MPPSSVIRYKSERETARESEQERERAIEGASLDAGACMPGGGWPAPFTRGGGGLTARARIFVPKRKSLSPRREAN